MLIKRQAFCAQGICSNSEIKQYIIKWDFDKYLRKKINRYIIKKRSMRNAVKEKWNILYIISSSALAGTERELLNIIKGSDRSQFQNFVICAKSGPLVEQLSREGQAVKIIKHINTLNIFSQLELYRFLKERDIDLACLMGNRIAAIAAIIHGAIVVQRRNQPTLRIRKIGRNIFINWFLYKFINKIITVSESIRRNIIASEKIDPQKIVTIHNGIDIELYKNKISSNEEGANLGPNLKKPTLGIIARLEEQKGHKYFLKAAQKVIAAKPNVHFLIAGEGSLRKQLEKLAVDLNIARQIEFCGFRHDVSNVLCGLDIFILSSLWEGFPFILLEAMACSCPIIATDAGGVKEMIQHNISGLLVPTSNEDAIADAILQLLNDRSFAQKLAREAYKTVCSNFFLAKMVERTESLYKQLLGNEKN